MISRRFANILRFLLDECLPPALRDNRYFMYPFYWMAYRGKNINEVMDLKRNVYGYSKTQYRRFYESLDSISRNRRTDLNEGCIRRIVDAIPRRDGNILDVGCGNGYLLQRLHNALPDSDLVGCDITSLSGRGRFPMVEADTGALPFADESFDVVTCCHTLEHIVDLDAAIDELKRVARYRLLLVIPKQRYYLYTLDEHVNFFPQREHLLHRLGMADALCEEIQGDWFCMVALAPLNV